MTPSDKSLSLAKAAHQFVVGLVLLVISGIPLAIVGGAVAAIAVAVFRFTLELFS